jgi:hypothetical protein
MPTQLEKVVVRTDMLYSQRLAPYLRQYRLPLVSRRPGAYRFHFTVGRKVSRGVERRRFAQRLTQILGTHHHLRRLGVQGPGKCSDSLLGGDRLPQRILLPPLEPG